MQQDMSLKQLQEYMRQLCHARGWDRDSYLQKMLLLTEEVGELAKAARQRAGLYAEKKRRRNDRQVAEELADVLSYVLDLANYFEVDLDRAFWQKEKKNAGRVWHQAAPDSDPVRAGRRRRR